MTLGRTVRELEATLGADELAEWQAFHRLSPWGPEIDDLRTSTSQAIAINTAMGRKGQAVKPADLRLGKPRPRTFHSSRERALAIRDRWKAWATAAQNRG